MDMLAIEFHFQLFFRIMRRWRTRICILTFLTVPCIYFGFNAVYVHTYSIVGKNPSLRSQIYRMVNGLNDSAALESTVKPITFCGVTYSKEMDILSQVKKL